MLVFAACVFPVHLWTVINMLREVPAWVLRLSSWQLVGVVSYALMVALVESLLLLAGLVIVGIALPRAVLDDSFVAQASMAALLTSVWAVVAHYNDQAIRLWGLRQFALWGMVYLASILLAYGLIRRFEQLKRVLNALVEGLSVLSFLYVFADLLSVTVVIVRNL